MKRWEKTVTAAMTAAMIWVWYDAIIKCPACKAEESRRAARRGLERHRRHHGTA